MPVRKLPTVMIKRPKVITFLAPILSAKMPPGICINP